jgi:hypothetical protein
LVSPQITLASVVVVVAHSPVDCPEQTPAMQKSFTVQSMPSLQPLPLGSFDVQPSATSLQDSLQLLSPSGPGHGLPGCWLQAPPWQLSFPLQNWPSWHGVPFASGDVQAPDASLQLSEQFPSPSAPGHGFPECNEQLPPLHVSEPLQWSASLHAAELFACSHAPESSH